MKSKSFRDMDWVSDGTIEYFRHCIESYGLDMDFIGLMFWPYSKTDIPADVRCSDGYATTKTWYSTSIDGKIDRLSFRIYIPFEQMLREYIDMECNKHKLLQFNYFVIDHEFGHIIHETQSLLGKPEEEFDRYFATAEESVANIPKNRKNASIENRMRYILNYFHAPMELAANQIAGITDEMIIRHEGLHYDLSERQLSNLIKKLLPYENEEG